MKQQIDPGPSRPAVAVVPAQPPGVSLDERLHETVAVGALGAAPTAPPVGPIPDMPPLPREPVRAALRAATVALPAPAATPSGPERAEAGPPFEAIGATLFAYLRNESAAALCHLQALGSARSPAEVMRLQAGELQRAADATLTCWSRLARDASRLMTPR